MDQYYVFYSFGASFSGLKPSFICTKNIGKRYFGRATLAEPRWPLASATIYLCWRTTPVAPRRPGAL